MDIGNILYDSVVEVGMDCRNSSALARVSGLPMSISCKSSLAYPPNLALWHVCK